VAHDNAKEEVDPTAWCECVCGGGWVWGVGRGVWVRRWVDM